MTSRTPLDDERLQFYLRHKDRIEEWAALGREVRQATVETLTALSDLIEPLSTELGAEVRLDDARGAYPRWVLRRSVWPEANMDALVSVVLEGERASIDPASTSSAPYVGIRVGDPNGAGAAIRAALAPLGKREDLKSKGYRGGAAYWPVFRRVVAGELWWEDVGGWGVMVRDALRDAWFDLAQSIDEAIEQLRN